MTKRLSLGGRLRMAAACPDANAQLLSEAADAIEQHEAFRQEVSDAIVDYFGAHLVAEDGGDALARLVVPAPKPDPLVEAMVDCGVDRFESWADQLRVALEARGFEIREKNDD